MAKKNKNQEDLELLEDENIEDDEKPAGKKKSRRLLKLLIFLVIIAVPTIILSFDIGNVRTKYIRPSLEKIPIVKNILPPLKEEETIEEEIKDEKQDTIDSLIKEIDELNKEIERLKVFEDNQLKFKEEKEEFDKIVALKDTKAYTKFYESISPENAEELYKQAVEKNVKDKKFKDYIQTFESMKKDAASTILEELILTDIDLVVDILENLSNEKRSEILSVMDPKNAASISKILAPIEE